MSAIAERQHGLITHAQLTELGVGRGALRHRIGTGALHKVHHGVYAVGHRALRPQAKLLGLVLASGPDAALSHAAAAHLRRIRRSAAAPVDVTRPSRGGRQPVCGSIACRCRLTRSRSSTASRSRPSSARSWTSPRSCVPTRCVTRSRRPRSRPAPTGAFSASWSRRPTAAEASEPSGRSSTSAPSAPGSPRASLERAFLAFLRRHGLPLRRRTPMSRATRSTACGAAPGSSWSSTAGCTRTTASSSATVRGTAPSRSRAGGSSASTWEHIHAGEEDLERDLRFAHDAADGLHHVVEQARHEQPGVRERQRERVRRGLHPRRRLPGCGRRGRPRTCRAARPTPPPSPYAMSCGAAPTDTWPTRSLGALAADDAHGPVAAVRHPDQPGTDGHALRRVADLDRPLLAALLRQPGRRTSRARS